MPGYDLDGVIYSDEWKTLLDENSLRNYFADVNNKDELTVAELTSGTVTHYTGFDRYEVNYFGARYLDPMLGLWISVDKVRQFDSPYTYVKNNPVIGVDPDGNVGLFWFTVIAVGTAVSVNSCINTADAGVDSLSNAAVTYGRSSLEDPVSQEQIHATNKSAGDFLTGVASSIFSFGTNAVSSMAKSSSELYKTVVENGGEILHAIQNEMMDVIDKEGVKANEENKFEK